MALSFFQQSAIYAAYRTFCTGRKEKERKKEKNQKKEINKKKKLKYYIHLTLYTIYWIH